MHKIIPTDIAVKVAVAELERFAGTRVHSDSHISDRITSPVQPAGIIESFQHYMKQEGTKARRAEFVGILDAHLRDRGFCSDMESLLRTGINYDPQSAGRYVKTNLLSLLPE